MKNILLIMLLFLTYMQVFSSQTIEISINVKNNLNKTMPYPMSFGISTEATDLLDKNIDEKLFPPKAPLGFYAAFEFIDSTEKESDSSTYYNYIWTNKDLKHYPIDTQYYHTVNKLICEFGTGNKIIINWNKNLIDSRIDSIFLRDKWDGLVANINMKNQNSYEWTNDGLKELFIHTYYNLKPTSVEEYNDNSIIIYPNPFTDFIKLNTTREINYIEIIDMIGNKILIPDNFNTIDTSTLPVGLYILKINMGKEIIIKKIIKQ